jgi:hypothetical protein
MNKNSIMHKKADWLDPTTNYKDEILDSNELEALLEKIENHRNPLSESNSYSFFKRKF